MKPIRKLHADARQGVALIIVLGLLAVMTISSIAFTISMRVERVAARHYLESVRAKHLVHAGLVEAMAQVHKTMVSPDRRVYPDWLAISGVQDALCSRAPVSATGVDVKDLFGGEATRMVAESLHDQVLTLNRTQPPQWLTQGITNGRIAYLIVNQSGLVDANYMGGSVRDISTNMHEVNISGSPDITTQPKFTQFVANRTDRHVRYETLAELSKLNTGLVRSPVTNLSVFSLDINRDEMFVMTNKAVIGSQWWKAIETRRPPPTLGNKGAKDFLYPKFPINSIVNYPGYQTPNQLDGYKNDFAFMTYYFWPVAYMMQISLLPATATSQERAGDVAWNLINYLDPDRVPQGGIKYDTGVVTPVESAPWRYTEGGEAIPLVNEIVFERVGAALRIAVELWYPFAPRDIQPSDNFRLQVGVFDNPYRPTSTAVNAFPTEQQIMTLTNGLYSWGADIPTMQFGTPTEFFVRRSPSGKEIPLTVLPKYLLIRVIKVDGGVTNICDESMGYDNSTEKNNAEKRYLFSISGNVTNGWGYSVADPRSNGQIKYWVTKGETLGSAPRGPIGGYDYPEGINTLGTTNLNCKPWVYQGTYQGQGVPIYMPIPNTNGPPMRNIAELGHLFISNLDDEETIGRIDRYWWRTINLMRKEQGALLLDLMTVRNTPSSIGGVFAINSNQRGAIESMFRNLDVGTPPKTPVNWPGVTDISSSLATGKTFVSYYDMFETKDSPVGGGGPLADAFRKSASTRTADQMNDIYREDPFRSICEMITFRQNIFTVIVAAQALAADNTTVVAEKRAVATIYRDAYTGRYFTRSLKWLQD